MITTTKILSNNAYLVKFMTTCTVHVIKEFFLFSGTLQIHDRLGLGDNYMYYR